MVEDYIRAMYMPHVKYILDRTDTGTVKAVIKLPSDLKYLNATIMTPISGYEYLEIPLHERFFKGLMMEKQVSHSGWHILMDNTRFTAVTLRDMTGDLSSKSLLN